MLGLVMRADVGTIFGGGIKQSPIAEDAPKNRELIASQDNIKDSSTSQVEPKHENTTALVVGVGSKPDSDFDSSLLQSIFYTVPKSKKSQLFSIARLLGKLKQTGESVFHNHAAIFKLHPEANSEYQLGDEIADVIKNGEFIGMEHLIDSSTFKKGVLGLSYVRSIIKR